jgi:hypothetical protein
MQCRSRPITPDLEYATKGEGSTCGDAGDENGRQPASMGRSRVNIAITFNAQHKPRIEAGAKVRDRS